tara:strand:- start:849 stop:1517 length:669 start_codon:yes stop_codon:yes gene_type:complete
MKKNKKLMVFDFDGTITLVDTFKLMIIIRTVSSPKYWKSLFFIILKFFKHRDKLKFRVELQKTLWNKKVERKIFFKKIFKNKFFKTLIRNKVLDYCKLASKTQSVLFLTANEKSIVKAFLKIYLDINNKKISVIGSNFNKDNYKIIKGIEKLKSLKKYLYKSNFKNKYIIYNFFDSNSDLHLTQICDYNIVVGRLNYFRLKKINPNLIRFNIFLNSVKNFNL